MKYLSIYAINWNNVYRLVVPKGVEELVLIADCKAFVTVLVQRI